MPIGVHDYYIIEFLGHVSFTGVTFGRILKSPSIRKSAIYTAPWPVRQDQSITQD